MDTPNLLLPVFVAVLLLTATYSAVPRPIITRHQYSGSELTGPVVIGVNKSNTIWCTARNRVSFMGLKKLRQLFWVYNSEKLVPGVNRGQSSDFDVYTERFAGSHGVDNATWRRVLHFKRAQPSSAGNYACVASYSGNINFNQSVDIQVLETGTPPTTSGTPPTTSGTPPTTSGTHPTTSGSSNSNAVNCSYPGNLRNGQHSLSSTTYNSLVTYTCDVGYTLQGANSRTCQSNGQWSGSMPQCTLVANIYSSSALTITLPLDNKTRGGASFMVWYSTDGHDRDPSSPPQGAPMVSTGLNSTSVTIPLPESDNSCKPYYVWIAGITPNGQQGPYSARQQVEVCKACREQSTCAAASAGATVAGSLLGGAVVGSVVALLVVGILCGSWKLKHSGGGKSCEVEEDKTYDTVGPKESTAMCDHVAMETNPAYGVCS